MATIVNFLAGSRAVIAEAISTFVGVLEGADGGVKTRRAARRVIIVGPDGTGKTQLAHEISREISSRLKVKAPIFHHDYATGLAWFKSMNVPSGYAKTMEVELANSWVVYDRHPAIDFPVYDMALRGGNLVKPYITGIYSTPYNKWFKHPVVREALADAIIVLLRDQMVKPSADRGDPEGIQDSLGSLREQYDNAVFNLCMYDRSLVWTGDAVVFRETIN